MALYPFTLLATYAHEMGHGLTAVVVGGNFERLLLFPDGSGSALTRTAPSALNRALVAAGGLVGPSLVGGVWLAATRVERGARWLLLLAALVGLGSLVLVVRNPFGFGFIAAASAVLIVVVRFRPSWSAWTSRVLAVQMALSVFRDVDYMFANEAVVGGVVRPSDAAQIADALLLPYWFWGGLCAIVAFASVALGSWVAVGGRVRGRTRDSSPSRRSA